MRPVWRDTDPDACVTLRTLVGTGVGAPLEPVLSIRPLASPRDIRRGVGMLCL